MKDKSRFVSSVIVSLLAGFIYLLSGENVPLNIQSSVKGVMSSGEPERYLTADCFPFYEISKKSDPKTIKKNSRFYLKDYDQGDEQFSEVVTVNQARFVIPVADRNVDFTSELKKLIDNKSEDLSEAELQHYINSRTNKTLSCNEFQIADAERNFKRSERINKDNVKFSVKYDKGNGFKYNYVTEELSEDDETGKTENLNEISDVNGTANEFKITILGNCNSNFDVKWSKSVNKNYRKNKVNKVEKIIIKIPKVKERSERNECRVKCREEKENDEDIDINDNDNDNDEDIELNVLDESDEEDSM